MYMPNRGQDKRYLKAENAENQNAGFNYWLDLTAGASELWIKVYLMGEYGSIMDGKPVFPEYKDGQHCAADPLEPHRGLPLILAWDFGITPCVALCQLTPRGQMRVINELCAGAIGMVTISDDDDEQRYVEEMGIRDFATRIVKPYLMNHYADMHLVSIGDPAGKQRSQTDETTCYQELMKAGIPTESARTNNFMARRLAVVGFMHKNYDGQSGFQISPKCKVLRKGFTKYYYYTRLKAAMHQERLKPEPEKLHPWSDIQDGVQYAAMYFEGGSVKTQTTPMAGVQNASNQARPVRKGSLKGCT
jgi:hypothetical protein